MLLRKDLAKEFELVVQQEITNHNNAMLSTNLALNDLRQQIQDNKKAQDEVNANYGSQISQINSRLNEFSEFILILTQKLQSHINDMAVYKEKAAKEIKLSVENSLLAHHKHEMTLGNVESLHVNFQELADSVVGLSVTFTQELQQEVAKIRNEIQKTKNEILNLPSEAKKVKKELEEKMAIDRVDFAGVMKELQVYKKTSFIQEKNIEHIYTLISRIEKRIPV